MLHHYYPLLLLPILSIREGAGCSDYLDAVKLPSGGLKYCNPNPGQFGPESMYGQYPDCGDNEICGGDLDGIGGVRPLQPSGYTTNEGIPRVVGQGPLPVGSLPLPPLQPPVGGTIRGGTPSGNGYGNIPLPNPIPSPSGGYGGNTNRGLPPAPRPRPTTITGRPGGFGSIVPRPLPGPRQPLPGPPFTLPNTNVGPLPFPGRNPLTNTYGSNQQQPTSPPLPPNPYPTIATPALPPQRPRNVGYGNAQQPVRTATPKSPYSQPKPRTSAPLRPRNPRPSGNAYPQPRPISVNQPPVRPINTGYGNTVVTVVRPQPPPRPLPPSVTSLVLQPTNQPWLRAPIVPWTYETQLPPGFEVLSINCVIRTGVLQRQSVNQFGSGYGNSGGGFATEAVNVAVDAIQPPANAGVNFFRNRLPLCPQGVSMLRAQGSRSGGYRFRKT